jgi:hypothetical protein
MGNDPQEAAQASMISMFIANNAPLMAAMVKGTKRALQQVLKSGLLCSLITLFEPFHVCPE